LPSREHQPNDILQNPRPSRPPKSPLWRRLGRLFDIAVLRQVRSRRALDAGCDDRWKDIVALDSGNARPAGPGPVFHRRPGRLLVCFYRSPGHGQLPVGVLTRRW
jgi:hypothetical protein